MRSTIEDDQLRISIFSCSTSDRVNDLCLIGFSAFSSKAS